MYISLVVPIEINHGFLLRRQVYLHARTFFDVRTRTRARAIAL